MMCLYDDGRPFITSIQQSIGTFAIRELLLFHVPNFDFGEPRLEHK